VRATDPDVGTDLSFSAIGLPEGATLDADTGVFSWTPGAGQSGEYVITVVAHDGHLSDRQTIVLRASLEPVPPTVLLELTPSFPAIPGQRVLVHAVADSFAAITSLRVFVAGQEVTLDADGRAYVTPTDPGKLDVRAVATDADGGVGETSAQLKTRDPADRSAPVVALDSALTRGRLRAATPLLGTVQDINLDFWKLEIAHGADGAFTLLAEGDASVDGTLATLDPATSVERLLHAASHGPRHRRPDQHDDGHVRRDRHRREGRRLPAQRRRPDRRSRRRRLHARAAVLEPRHDTGCVRCRLVAAGPRHPLRIERGRHGPRGARRVRRVRGRHPHLDDAAGRHARGVPLRARRRDGGHGAVLPSRAGSPTTAAHGRSRRPTCCSRRAARSSTPPRRRSPTTRWRPASTAPTSRSPAPTARATCSMPRTACSRSSRRPASGSS
jgi:hypothetical protein